MTELFSRRDGTISKSRGTSEEASKRIDDHTGSETNLRLARFWLQDCQRNHEECAKFMGLKDHESLPSRVIDVTDREQPYVLEVEGHLQHDDYLTLSYCWGHGKRLLNTKADTEKFRKGLPIGDRMPQTFREAFQVTTALGYRYIWIDALCILQDDPLDLQKEMTKMGEIYENSALTIFAGKGASVQAGLFASRDGLSFKPSNVCIQTTERNSDVKHNKHVSFVSATYTPEDPLSRRAWILQEQVLAQRQLVFTSREIMWTCKTTRLSERCPQQYESTESKGSKMNVKLPDLAPVRSLKATLSTTASTAETSSTASKQHFSVWYKTVESYNARNLTVASDKLPAISAIARLIHTRYGCEYGAGLFKEDLSVGLCWTTDRAEADADPSNHAIYLESPNALQAYVAPSWSWACLRDTPLIWKGKHGKHEAPEEGIKVLDWHFTYAPDAMIPFGQIESGVLTVRSHLQQLLLVPQFGEEKWPPSQRRIWGAYAVDPSTASIVEIVALDTFALYCDLKKRFDGLDCTKEAFKASPADFMSRALLVSCLLTHVSRQSSHRNVLSLVLVPQGLNGDEFRRIGLLMEGSLTSEQWASITADPRKTIKIV